MISQQDDLMTKLTDSPRLYKIKGCPLIITRYIYNKQTNNIILVILFGEHHDLVGNLYEVLRQITRDFDISISLLIEHPFSKSNIMLSDRQSASNIHTLGRFGFDSILTQATMVHEKQLSNIPALLTSHRDKSLNYFDKVIAPFQGELRVYGIDPRFLYLPELLNIQTEQKFISMYQSKISKRYIVSSNPLETQLSYKESYIYLGHKFILETMLDYRTFESSVLQYKQNVYQKFDEFVSYCESAKLHSVAYISEKEIIRLKHRLKYFKKFVDDPTYKGNQSGYYAGNYVKLIEQFSKLHDDTKFILVNDILPNYYTYYEAAHINIILDVAHLVRFIKQVRKTTSNEILMSLTGSAHTQFIEHVLNLDIPSLWLFKGEAVENIFISGNLSLDTLTFDKLNQSIDVLIPTLQSNGQPTNSMIAYRNPQQFLKVWYQMDLQRQKELKKHTELQKHREQQLANQKSISSLNTVMYLIIGFVLFNVIYCLFRSPRKKQKQN
jgi:hypothetical protein